MAEPLPTESDGEAFPNGQDTDSAYDLNELIAAASGQSSSVTQGTMSNLGALQDTTGSADSMPPPPPLIYETGFRTAAFRQLEFMRRLLWIAIPAGVAAGFALGWAAAKLL